MNKELLSKFVYNNPQDMESIFEFSDTVIEGIITWIQKAFAPIKTVNTRHSSYSLKHILQENVGLYLTENQFKMAMILAGFEPANYNSIAHYYRISQNSIALQLKRVNHVMQISAEEFERVLNSGIEVSTVMDIRWDLKWKDTDKYFNMDECINLYGYSLIQGDYGYGTVSVDNGDMLLFQRRVYNKRDSGKRIRETLYKIVNLATHEIIDVSWVASLSLMHRDFEGQWGKYSYVIARIPDEDRVKLDLTKFKELYNTDYIYAINDGRRRGYIQIEYFDKV